MRFFFLSSLSSSVSPSARKCSGALPVHLSLSQLLPQSSLSPTTCSLGSRQRSARVACMLLLHRTHSLTHTLSHSQTHSHTHSLTHTLTHSLTHTHTLSHSHTHAHLPKNFSFFGMRKHLYIYHEQHIYCRLMCCGIRSD